MDDRTFRLALLGDRDAEKCDHNATEMRPSFISDHSGGVNKMVDHVADVGKMVSAHIDLEAWKECPWCKSEYTIIDDDFGQPVHPNMVKFCWSCGRPLTPDAQAMLEKRLRG